MPTPQIKDEKTYQALRREGNSEKAHALAAQARKAVPGEARHAIDKGARTVRDQRGPLAAAVGALASALAALIIWKRRKRA
jgi:LPXTG-motif cell wall-anchored protein